MEQTEQEKKTVSLVIGVFIANLLVAIGISHLYAYENYKHGRTDGCAEAVYKLTASYDGPYKECYE
jgi:hypothetical protein